MLTSLFKPTKYWALVLLPLLFFTCSDVPDGTGTTATTGAGQNETALATGPTVADQFFSEAEMKALHTIKNRFEEGLRASYKQRTAGYAYMQHATRMRLDLLEQSPAKSVYPFNGGFSLAEVEGVVEQLPFIGHKCGFLKDETGEVVNYYCLGLDENYFRYLAALQDPNKLIKTFADAYQKQKAITPDIRRMMALESLDSLNMDDWDHQLFYLFFQCWTNEELMAYEKINTVMGPVDG